MDYLKRKIDDFLVAWKNRAHMPLIVSGARQVGKTEAILHFARGNYKNVVYINFALKPKYRVITQSGYMAEDVIKEITFVDDSHKFVPGETLIVFDEVQEFPEIATSLKGFNIDGRFDVIVSGSLLGVQYKRIASLAVGNQEQYELASMDFEEFLWAMGRGEDFVERLYGKMLSCTPYSEVELDVFSGVFGEYCTVGGMPAVVSKYVEQRNFSGVTGMQRDILVSYRSDVRKYCESLDQARISEVYRSVPAQLAKENKKFQYSRIEKGARARDYTGCVQWLEDAGMILRCFCMHALELPLSGNYDSSIFKIYYPDTGLLLANLDSETREDFLLRKNIHTYRGGIVENIVAEALYKAGKGLYYFKRENSTLEIDFVLRNAEGLVPIEVKSSNNCAKSLSTVIKSAAYEDVKCGVKLISGNIGKMNNIVTFPYFCASFLPRYLKDAKI